MDGQADLHDLRSSRRRIVLTVVVIVASIIGLLAVLRLFASGLPKITPDDLAAATERWEKSGLRNYRLTIVKSGRQTGEVKIEVRDGVAVGGTNNGVELKELRTREPWTVPGMFATLETDFDNAAHAAEKFGGAEVVMRCEFDAKYGYPRRYLHQILGTYGDLSWEVTEFEEMLSAE